MKLLSLLFTIVAAGVLAVSCNQSETPMQKVIRENVMAQDSNIKSLTISNIKIIDSTTVERELQLRKAVFHAKLSTENSMADKYRKKRMPVNEEKHRRKAKQADKILKELEIYQQTHNVTMDSVLYYTVTFDCLGVFSSGQKFPRTERMATITPSMEVMNIQGPKGDSHLGMGYKLPGYTEILDRHKLEDQK